MSDAKSEPTRSIAQVNRMVRSLIEAETLEHFFWARGRVERYYQSDLGHVYFDLVDGRTRIGCMLREHQRGHIPFELRNTLDVEVYGDVQVYEDRAVAQIQVIAARLLGPATDASTAIDILKREGLYPPRRKAAPTTIRRIGIVTSRSSRAVGDFESAYQSAGERAVLAPVKWQYVMLEGERAIPSIVDAIRKLDKAPEIDVIAIIRGGGRYEHMSTFDDIDIARAIIQSKTYIVTGIGHHKDVTFADDAADYVAATPTAAAYHLAQICLRTANATAKQTKEPAANRRQLLTLVIIALAVLAVVAIALFRSTV